VVVTVQLGAARGAVPVEAIDVLGDGVVELVLVDDERPVQ
jgi:hypothetical protein